jgi:hypothetical protein
VTLSLTDFLRHGADVLARTTARHLYPLAADDWRPLVAHPAARHLRGVVFGDLADGDDLATALAGMPELAGCRSLTLVSAGLSDAGLARLAAAGHFAGLERLVVASNDLTAAGLRALSGATFAAPAPRRQPNRGPARGVRRTGGPARVAPADRANPRR